jgi:hypothetical protein
MQQLDEQIALIDKSMADDRAQRTRRKNALQGDRDQLRARVKQIDDVLAKVRGALKAPTAPPAPGPAATPAGPAKAEV